MVLHSHLRRHCKRPKPRGKCSPARVRNYLITDPKELKRTTESMTMVSYLDISITILESKYVTTVYDKRDDKRMTLTLRL